MIDVATLNAAYGYARRRVDETGRPAFIWTADNLYVHVSGEAPIGAWVIDVVEPPEEK